MMFSTVALTEFADKYSDHLVLTTSAGASGVLAGVWHVIPYEVATLLTVAAFLTLRICAERWWHKRKRQHHARHLRTLHRHPAKRRLRV